MGTKHWNDRSLHSVVDCTRTSVRFMRSVWTQFSSVPMKEGIGIDATRTAIPNIALLTGQQSWSARDGCLRESKNSVEEPDADDDL